MDRVVNLFALLIVFVFDPLAVALIVGYNRLALKHTIVKDEKKYEIYKEVEEVTVNETQDLDNDDEDVLYLEDDVEEEQGKNRWGLGRQP